MPPAIQPTYRAEPRTFHADGVSRALYSCLGARLQVGDQSDFVTAMGRTLQEFGPPLGAALPEHHFAFLCDKVRPQ